MSFTWTDFISLLAIIISVFTFVSQQTATKKENQAALRVEVQSKGDKVTIFLDNVGNTIVKIKESIYEFSYDDGEKLPVCRDNIAPFFYKIDCVSKTSENLVNDYLFPNSTHTLLCITVRTQDALLNVWKIIKHITATISFEDTYGNQKRCSYKLAESFKSFEEAITDKEPIIEEFADREIEELRRHMRPLIAFQSAKNRPQSRDEEGIMVLHGTEDGSLSHDEKPK